MRAKTLHLDIGKPIPQAEYDNALEHLINSGTWFAFNTFRSTTEVLDKFLEKGAPDDYVEVVDRTGNVSYRNLPKDAIDYLTENGILDDWDSVQGAIFRQVSAGKGEFKIREYLYRHKFDKDLIERGIREIYHDVLEEEIERKMTTFFHVSIEDSNRFKNAESEAEKREVLYSRFSARGYSGKEIKNWIEDNIDFSLI